MDPSAERRNTLDSLHKDRKRRFALKKEQTLDIVVGFHHLFVGLLPNRDTMEFYPDQVRFVLVF